MPPLMKVHLCYVDPEGQRVVRMSELGVVDCQGRY